MKNALKSAKIIHALWLNGFLFGEVRETSCIFALLSAHSVVLTEKLSERESGRERVRERRESVREIECKIWRCCEHFFSRLEETDSSAIRRTDYE